MTQTSLLSMPPDVLSRIALQSVYQSSPTSTCASRLRTLSSLLILCRDTHARLSLSTNPYIYGKIFRLFFDVEPIRRRLGTAAIRSTVLAYELQRRLVMLKRLKAFLCKPNDSGLPSPEAMISDLILLLFMLTESDGKNILQLRRLFGNLGVADLCIALLSSSSPPSHSAVRRQETERIIRSLVTIVMWINQEEICESLETTNIVLDILEPFAVQSHAHRHRSSVEFTYFDLSGSLVLSSLAYTRLCIVQRYDIIKHRQLNSLSETSSRVSLTSSDIDIDFSRLTRFHGDSSELDWRLSRSIITNLSFNALSNPDNSHASFETVWSGGWFVPSSEITIYKPMRFRIRAYVPSPLNALVQFVETGEDEEDITRAWFNEGVQFLERVDSLSVSDPITGRTSLYEPRSSDLGARSVIDTIFCGETIAAHDDNSFVDFRIHGRIRNSDGKVALIRKPASADMHDLGVWVFHGFLYCGYSFVGDWWNTSTAKDAPGGNGWFRFVEDKQQR